MGEGKEQKRKETENGREGERWEGKEGKGGEKEEMKRAANSGGEVASWCWGGMDASAANYTGMTVVIIIIMQRLAPLTT